KAVVETGNAVDGGFATKGVARLLPLPVGLDAKHEIFRKLPVEAGVHGGEERAAVGKLVLPQICAKRIWIGLEEIRLPVAALHEAAEVGADVEAGPAYDRRDRGRLGVDFCRRRRGEGVVDAGADQVGA